MNRLANEQSAYLRHAADQPIHWYPWSDEPFERAGRENKPVLLSSGAVWCHWCHVMAKESFYDADVAAFINEHFIAVKLDRDEQPGIDRRYQQAVAVMGGSGGWPLTVFLMPDRKPFFGGTYFPPEDLGGRRGFRSILEGVRRLYGENRDAAGDFSRRLIDALKPEPPGAAELSPAMLADAEDAMVQQADPYDGGFGSAPKFPLPGAISFLIGRYARSGSPEVGTVVRDTLARMALGGIHDHLQGGFHRYSVDAGWNVPHFEKMADDNAWLLRNYVEAWAVFGDPIFRVTAEGIVRFVREVLAHADGGYSASQDADVTPDDEGGYFTWTARQMRSVLDVAEYELLTRCYMRQRGAMHHDPDKFVLSGSRPLASVAEELGTELSFAEAALRSGMQKLLSARLKRETPLVDTARYASLNGMLITSLVLAARAFEDMELLESAKVSLERIFALRKKGDALFHVDNVPALLDDYVFLAEASLAVYEATADEHYLAAAREVMALCRARLWDAEGGGFHDTDTALLGIRLKPSDDMPHPAANSVAAMVLLKLYRITDEEAYRSDAEAVLRAFVARAAAMGLHAGAFFYALDMWYSGITLTVGAGTAGSQAAECVRRLLFLTIRHGGMPGPPVPCSPARCFEPLADDTSVRSFIAAEYPGIATGA
ncbi:MAG TPA: thioredoxin domain-containing protein [Dissulfurispiraceae bacterium]|nr:thioredoxin domain-containing protein [Dissulfurispiraceae bacterium]